MQGHGQVSDYDAKKFTCCRPYNGERGDAWRLQFAPDFLAALMSKTDDDSRNDLEEHLLGTDEGGTDDAGNVTAFTGALTAALNPNAVRLLSMKYHQQRGKEAFALLRKHVIRRDIQVAMDALPLRRGRQAWILLTTYGMPHESGLLVISKEGKWTGIRLSLVGINLETIILIRGLIDACGLEQAIPKSVEEKRVKFLSIMRNPEQLHTKAIEELARPSYLNVAGDVEVLNGAAIGAASYDRTVNAFDLSYRHYFSQGHPSLRPTPAVVENQGARTNRVDANRLASNERSEFLRDTYEETYSGDFELPEDAGEDWQAFSASLYNNGGTNEELQFAYEMSTIVGETPCWGCWGWGHRKSECPNPRARNIKDCQAGLLKRMSETRSTFGNSEMARRPVPSSATTVRNRFMNRGRGRGRSSRFARGGQGRSSGRGRGRNNSFNVDIDGDTGDAYDEYGEYMGFSLTSNGTSADANDASTSSSSTTQFAQPPTNSVPEPQVSSLMRSEPERGTTGEAPNSMAASRSEHLAFSNFDMGVCDQLQLQSNSVELEYDSSGSGMQPLVDADTSSASDDEAASQQRAAQRRAAEKLKRRKARNTNSVSSVPPRILNNTGLPPSAWHLQCEVILDQPLPGGISLPPESIYTTRLSFSDSPNGMRILHSGTDFDTSNKSIKLWNVTRSDAAVCKALGAESKDDSWYIPAGIPYGHLGSWMSDSDVNSYNVVLDDSRQIAEAARRQIPCVAIPDSGCGRSVYGNCIPPDAPPDTSTGDGSFIESTDVIFDESQFPSLEQPSFLESLLMPFTAMLSLFLGMIALIGRFKPGHIMLFSFLAYAVSYAAASPITSHTMPGLEILTSSIMLTAYMRPTVTEIFDHRSMPRGQSLVQRFNYKSGHLAGDFSYGNPDSGTTKTASGNRKLFPTNLIRQWKPNLRVRVASNATMTVAFIGIMILPTRREPPPKHANAGELLSFKLGIIDAMY